MTYCSFNFYLITLHLKLTFLNFLVRRLASVTLKHTAIWSRKTVKNCYKPDQTAGVDSLFSVCSNPREVTVENNFLMNAITHFFQPPAYVFFILLDFWGHRFAAFQKTAEIDFELRGRHVGKPHYVLRVRKMCVRPTTAKHLLRYERKQNILVTRFFKNQLGPVVRRPISANPGLNFNLGFSFSFVQKHFPG